MELQRTTSEIDNNASEVSGSQALSKHIELRQAILDSIAGIKVMAMKRMYARK